MYEVHVLKTSFSIFIIIIIIIKNLRNIQQKVIPISISSVHPDPLFEQTNQRFSK
jgi:hypothetical protein